MNIPDKDKVRKTLKPIEEEIISIVHKAWGDWIQINKCSPIFYPRTRANIVWEKIVTHAQDTLPENYAVGFREHNQTVFFSFGDVVFRFKKGNEKGLSNNVPTQMALAFHNHEEQLNLEFPDYDNSPMKRVEIVYNIDKWETKIDKIMVVARDGESILWTYELESSVADIGDITKPEKQTKSPKELLQPKNLKKKELDNKK